MCNILINNKIMKTNKNRNTRNNGKYEKYL